MSSFREQREGLGAEPRHYQQDNVKRRRDQRDTEDSPGSLGVCVAGVDVHALSLRGWESAIKQTPYTNVTLVCGSSDKLRETRNTPNASGGTRMRKLTCALILVLACHLAAAQAADVDGGRSSIMVKVEKTGLFSAFAHNHTIQAPIASGKLDIEKRTAALTFNAKEMKVLDEGVKDSERADIDQTMKSDKVLDVQRFPEIRFASTSITPQDGGRYQV